MTSVSTPPDEVKSPILPPRWKHPCGHFVLTLDEAHCNRLRELPDWSGRDPEFVAEDFLSKKTARWARDVEGPPEGAELRVLVDQYSRQAFLIHGLTIVHIDSF